LLTTHFPSLSNTCPTTPDARDLIQKMLDTNPVTRWTVPKILTHPWFTKHRPAGYEVQNYQPLAKPEDTGGPIIIDDDTIAGKNDSTTCAGAFA
jgi:serine/threonine protein kinase